MSSPSPSSPSAVVVVKLLQARTITAKHLLPPHIKISVEAITAINALLTSLAVDLSHSFASSQSQRIEALLPNYLAGHMLSLSATAILQGVEVPQQLWPPSATLATLTSSSSSATAADTTTLAHMQVHAVLHTVAKFIVGDLLAKHCQVTNTSSVRAEHVALQVGACADLAPASVKLAWPTLLASLTASSSSSSHRSSSTSSTDSVSGASRGAATPDCTDGGSSRNGGVSEAVARASMSLQSILDSKPADPSLSNSRGRPLDRRLSYRPLAHSLSASPSRQPGIHAHSPTSPASSSSSSTHYPPHGASPPPPLPAVPLVPEFDDLIQSSQTVKFSLTPTRIRSLDTSPAPPPPVIVERGRHLSIDTGDPTTPTPAQHSIAAASPTPPDHPSPLSTIDGSPVDSHSPAADSPTTPTKKKKTSGLMAIFRSSTISSKSKKDVVSKRASAADGAGGGFASASMGNLPPPPVPQVGLKKSASSAAIAAEHGSPTDATRTGAGSASPPRADPVHVTTRDRPPPPLPRPHNEGSGKNARPAEPPRSPRSPITSDAGNRTRARSLSQPTSPRPKIPPPTVVARSPEVFAHQEEVEVGQPRHQAMLTVTTAFPPGGLPGGPGSAGAQGFSSVASSPTVVASPNIALMPPIPSVPPAAVDNQLPQSAIRSRTTSARTGGGDIADVVDLYYTGSSEVPPSASFTQSPAAAQYLGPRGGDDAPPVSPSSVTAIRHYNDDDQGQGSDTDAAEQQLLARRRFSPRSDSIQGTLALMTPTPRSGSPAAASSGGGSSALAAGWAASAPGWRRGSEPLTSPVRTPEGHAGLSRSATCSPHARHRTHTFDGTTGSLHTTVRGRLGPDGEAGAEDDMQSNVSYGSNMTNTSLSSRHPSSVGPPLPTSWSTSPSPPPVTAHPRVPPLPATLASLPPASLISLIHSLHTHLTLTVHDLDAAHAAAAAGQQRLDTLATRAVRKITDLQAQVEARDREVGELRAELKDVRDRLERVVGLVASVVPRVVGGQAGGATGGNSYGGPDAG